MRYPPHHKQAVRARIVRAASRSLRSHGLTGVGIPALMKRARLTHGGFYAHFESRDELVAEAVAFAAGQTAQAVFTPGLALKDVLARYLSLEHVQRPADGCVLAALGAESTHEAPAVRRAFQEASVGFVALVQRTLGEEVKPDAPPSPEALRLASQLLGAVVLARLLDDEALAERTLRAVRDSAS